MIRVPAYDMLVDLTERCVNPATATPQLADLTTGTWGVWRTAVLRGAGFPAEMVSRLVGGHAATAARAYVAARSRRCDAMATLLAHVRATIADSTDRRLRTRLRAIERRLRRGRTDVPWLASDAAPWLQDDRARIAALEEQEHQALAALTAAHDLDLCAIDAALGDILSDPRVQEAMLWQNPASLRYARATFARNGAKRRRASELVARVVQRLAVKNDTYSFFGPVGWASLGEGGGYVQQMTGVDLIARRHVYFEGWAIDALADRFDRDQLLTRWSAPRLATGAWVGADGLYTARSGPIALSPVERRIVGTCDGVRTPDDIAALVAGSSSPSERDTNDVLDVLSRMAGKGLLVWKVEVASQLHPEDDLERRIARVGDSIVRDRYATALRSLVEARDRLANCDGDPEQLEHDLDSLNALFTRLTGRGATRRHGQTYAARGLVYQDCCRAGSVVFGRSFLDRLGPPLAVVLDGVRWLVGEVALSVNDVLRDCHARCRPESGAIPAETFIGSAKRILWGEAGQKCFDEVEARFQAAWRDVLGEPVAERPNELRYDVAAVQARASRVFKPRADGWSLARHLSPDIMVAAEGRAAFERGDFTLVLGELHCSNTARWSLFASQHPALDELRAAVERDADGRVSVVVQISKDAWLARMNPLLIPPTAWRYESGGDLPSAPACRQLPAGSLVAIDDGGTIKMRARDGLFECDALEMFGHWLSPKTSQVAARFRPETAHAPRIVLGDLAIARESWHMAPADMPFLEETDRIQRFASVTAWHQAHGMPRWVFYKPADEPKPVYLDFESPLYVDVFVKLLQPGGRPAESVRIVEMLPRADQSWLVDGSARRYTSELRFVMPVPPRTSE